MRTLHRAYTEDKGETMAEADSEREIKAISQQPRDIIRKSPFSI